jgi:hypothetical protein
MIGRSMVACVVVTFVALAALPNEALARQACSCATAATDLCSGDGYQITFAGFSIDQGAGTSSWDYRICNLPNSGLCPAPARPFAHIAFTLPDIGTCLSASQSVVIAQQANFDSALLSCSVGNSDPFCGIGGTEPATYIAKCDLAAGSSLDAGECVTIRISVAGELPTLGAGSVITRTDTTDGCATSCMLGPSCRPCAPPPTGQEQCLTRTIGFWGTHPHITGLFLPITVCGNTLNTLSAGQCDSISEALCVAPGKESRRHQAYAQLIRQLAAAKLNLAASLANEGRCPAAILARIFECEALYCGGSNKEIVESACVEDLTAFNESNDTAPETWAPFSYPFPANPDNCRKANGNGMVIGKGSCE